MPDTNTDLTPDLDDKTVVVPPVAPALPTTAEELEALLNARVDEKLLGIKSKLDSAYAARDTANAETERLRKAARDAEIAALEKEGRGAEALKLQLEEAKAINEALEKRNLALSRDSELNSVLASLPFRTKRALDMAVQEITPQLVQDAAGHWKHTSGATIADYADTFAAHEDNSFLFKQKVNTGGGAGTVKPNPAGQQKALKDMTQQEVLNLASQGKLPRQKR